MRWSGAAETAVREIVGKSKMDFVLYEGREQIAAQASKLMQDILDRYKSGIQISKVTMQNAQPPEQVQAAFDDASRPARTGAQKNEGQAYANDVIPAGQGHRRPADRGSQRLPPAPRSPPPRAMPRASSNCRPNTPRRRR